ncbi:hypothetical protein GCM10009828_075810 [Actinoplanes couchii]|uniref:Uncharacterized protein n=1 Tax=Actinoplanes couchii TaxID=403638 RepID=A0ABQ3WZK4_9ACTN|nr:hypothetical protein Aco03nite_001140 [Actinoplanes couchii]
MPTTRAAVTLLGSQIAAAREERGWPAVVPRYLSGGEMPRRVSALARTEQTDSQPAEPSGICTRAD